jgi:hypothetical protein
MPEEPSVLRICNWVTELELSACLSAEARLENIEHKRKKKSKCKKYAAESLRTQDLWTRMF